MDQSNRTCIVLQCLPRLPTFLHRNPNLDLQARLTLILQLIEALTQLTVTFESLLPENIYVDEKSVELKLSAVGHVSHSTLNEG